MQIKLTEFCKRIKLPDEAVLPLCGVYKSIFPQPSFKCAETLLWNKIVTGEDTLADCDGLARLFGIEKRLFRLFICVYFAERSKKLFLARGFSEETFYHTMEDLTVWYRVCRRDFGTVGLEEYKWLKIHLRAGIFAVGRMQFEPSYFFGNEYTRFGRTLHRGDTVLNVHIPEGGAMTREDRLSAYAEAEKLLGISAFCCDSWLLYPPSRRYLSEKSNILDFMDDFDIISSEDDPGHSDMWRVFGQRSGYTAEELPKDTSLRRAYAELIADTGLTGLGYGVFFTENGINLQRRAKTVTEES